MKFQIYAQDFQQRIIDEHEGLDDISRPFDSNADINQAVTGLSGEIPEE